VTPKIDGSRRRAGSRGSCSWRSSLPVDAEAHKHVEGRAGIDRRQQVLPVTLSLRVLRPANSLECIEVAQASRQTAAT
jgi:hypothetical protein